MEYIEDLELLIDLIEVCRSNYSADSLQELIVLYEQLFSRRLPLRKKNISVDLDYLAIHIDAHYFQVLREDHLI